MNKIYFPGELIKIKNDLQNGVGTFVKEGKIYACIKGRLKEDCGVISLVPLHQQDPELRVGSILIGQVSNIKEDRVYIRILKIDDFRVHNFVEGVLRKQNIRVHEIDLIDIQKCYLPGDIVRIRLSSFGDSQKIFLSSAEQDLGVLFAKHSETQQLMIPQSWEEMTCCQSGLTEQRKVSKPDFSSFS